MVQKCIFRTSFSLFWTRPNTFKFSPHMDNPTLGQ
jgi:hypothetical protein